MDSARLGIDSWTAEKVYKYGLWAAVFVLYIRTSLHIDIINQRL
jgi:hypothetical protein